MIFYRTLQFFLILVFLSYPQLICGQTNNKNKNAKLYCTVDTNQYDRCHVDSIILLCDNYIQKGNYSLAQNHLRKCIIRYINKFENNPRLAIDLYTRLAKIYDIKGDTIWSDRIHCEKIQYYLIKEYLSNTKNKIEDHTIGLSVLDSYNSNRYVDDQYNHFQRIYDESFISKAELDGGNMEKIGAFDEAEWCYKYCIRLSSNYKSSYIIDVMFAYIHLLDIYANQDRTADFDTMFPQAVEYASWDYEREFNEFDLARTFGNTFKENGNKQQAYNCYKICEKYLESGKFIKNRQEQAINLFISLMAVCDDLSYYQEALNYCDYLDEHLNKDDESYRIYIFNKVIALSGLQEYNQILSLTDEVEPVLRGSNNSLLDFYYFEICFMKGASLILLGRNEEAKQFFKNTYEQLMLHPEVITGSDNNLYFYIAKGLMSVQEYHLALNLLERIAEIDIKESGKISESVQNNIDECKKHS